MNFPKTLLLLMVFGVPPFFDYTSTTTVVIVLTVHEKINKSITIPFSIIQQQLDDQLHTPSSRRRILHHIQSRLKNVNLYTNAILINLLDSAR